MTPEERARQLVQSRDWLLQLSDAVTETGDALTIEIVSEPFLEQLIADAIREAVRAEREACACLAERVAQELSQHNSDHQIAAFESLACRIVARRIREQEDG